MSIFEKNIIGIYGETGKSWIAKLPDLVCKLEALWNLTQLKPVANLTYNYVLVGFQNEIPIVLKLSLDSESLEREANALEVFRGYGAVSVLKKQKNALLLQRAFPGYSFVIAHYCFHNRLKDFFNAIYLCILI